MNRGTARRLAIERLRESGFESAALEADLLCSKALGCSRESLLAHLEEAVTPSEEEALFSLLKARLERVPVAYLKGSTSFWGRDILVGPGCLIPRPETETLVEKALDLFQGGNFADWGTGSGCIALAILSERPAARGLLIEKSPAALKWAWRNLSRSPFLNRALLWHGSSLGLIPSFFKPLELIVGNPPYIPSSEVESLMPDVLLYEPTGALDGGPDGLDYIWAILADADTVLARGGFLLLEIGSPQQAEILLNTPTGSLEPVEVKKDFAGKDRVVVWRHR